MKEKRVLLVVLIVLIAVSVTTTLTIAQGPTGTGQPRAPRTALGTGFTYQGQLKNGGSVVNGTCDLQFGLWDDESAGTRQGVTQTVTANVTNGLFTTVLNSGGEFGASAFDGTARWLAMAVRCPNGIGSYTALTSRQALTPAPYALYATNSSTAANATTATNFSGVLSGDVTGTQSSTTVTKLQGRTVASTAPTNGQVLKYDGTQWAPGTDNAASYQNVIVVAKSGGNYTTISDALSNISGNNATNRYLIWVAPGTYTETVTMKEYVDIEGAGEIATKITYTGSASSYTGTVVGATNAELRFLTVESTGGNTFASAISNGSASPRLTHLTATASGGTFRNYGVFNGSSSPTMTNVSATGSGGANCYGVYNTSSSAPTMTNVIATGSGGTGDNYGVYNYSSSPTMTNVTATGSGTTEAWGVYSYSSSPTMTNVIAIASGGTGNRGVHNYSSSPTMSNVTATASGGTVNYGVVNSFSSPTMTNVTATGSGGMYSSGVFNISSSPTIQNSTISGSGGTTNYGILNSSSSGSYVVKVNNSQIMGSTNTISNTTNFTTRIGASKLDGGVVTGAGTITCAGVYDENYTFYASTCP